MFKFIKSVLINKVIKNVLLSLSLFSIFKSNNNNIKIKENNKEITNKNKLITSIIVENNSCNKNKINLILLNKILKVKNKKKLIKDYNILNNNGIIEHYNPKYINYVHKKLCYPNIFLNNYNNNKEIKNLRKDLFFFYKQDIFIQKKFKKSRAYQQINPKKLFFIQSKYAQRTAHLDREFHKHFHHVNAIPKKTQEIKRNFIARLLLKQREKIMFFQGRPKIIYFKKLNKINKKINLKLKKEYLINFKKNLSEKKVYKKNNFLNLFQKYFYKTNIYKKRMNYNLFIKNNTNSSLTLYRYKYLKKIKELRKEYSLKRRLLPRIKDSIFHKIRRKKIIKKWVYSSNGLKTKYFYYSKYRYHRYFIKGTKKKIILNKENIIDSEYYYLDPSLLFLKLKLKKFNFNYESFDLLSSMIQDKGFSILLYVFIYIPIILFIHVIRKEYYKIK